MVPNGLLRQWFEQHGADDFDPDWDRLGEREVDPMLDFLTDLPPAKSAELEKDLRDVFELACDVGMNALNETARLRGSSDVLDGLPTDLNLYGRSMWARLNAPEIHSASFLIRDVDDLSYWRTRKDLPSVNLRVTDEMRDDLADAISAMLKSEGRGQQCSVETFRRGPVTYFFVYPDDFIRSDQVHDNTGRLNIQTVRPTMEIIFVYNHDEGSLRLSSILHKAAKEELERIFARCVLGWDLPPYDPEQVFTLDHLKDPGFQLTTDPVDQIRVRIEEMRMLNQVTGRQINLWVHRSDPQDTIHRAIEEELNKRFVPLHHTRVHRVVFQFEFLQTPQRRAGRQKVHVMAPHSCNIENARPERTEIFQKYFRLWGIERAATMERSPVAVGA
jgi:hypothetical protein